MIDTKRLRQKILDLAIHGKLVSQDPNDEPASVLLERIHEEKLRMVAEGKLKPKDVKNDSVIFKGTDNSHYEKVGDGDPVYIEDELPFELPEGWEWARLQSLMAFVTDGDHQPPQQSNSGPAFLVIGDVADGKLDFMNTRHVTAEYYENLSSLRKPTLGDILFTVTGSYGISIIVHTDVPFCVQRHIAILRPLMGLNEYIYRCLASGWIRQCCDSVATGIAQRTVGLTSLRKFLIPIPPLAEQHRIVAELDRLLGLVDQIERDQEDLDALLERARRKVLDLAVRGRLVPQDPEDEPASALLERVREEKLHMVAEGRLKPKDVKGDSVIFRGSDNSYYERTGNSQVVAISDIPFDLPSGWAWTRVSTLASSCGGKTPATSNRSFWDGGNIPWVTSKDMKSPILHDSQIKLTQAGSMSMNMVPKGSVLVVTRSGILRHKLPVAINRMDTTINQDIKALIPYMPGLETLLYLMIIGQESHVLDDYSKDGTTVESIDFSMLYSMPIPVPPEKETTRIANRCSELLGLMDL